MKRPSRLSYAFAVGRIRALEGKLVEKSIFREAAQEDDLITAMKIIFDAGSFSEEMIQVKNSIELDEYLEKEEGKTRRLLDEILLEKEILDVYLEDDKPEETILIAERTGYSFLKEYIRHKIDLNNIKLFFRVKYRDLPREKFESLAMEGGFLDVQILIQNYDLPFSEIQDKLRASSYSELFFQSAEALESRETFLVLERGIENFLMIYLRKAKHIVFGPEPVFAYGLARRRELDLVRLLGVGKLNNIPAEFLRERISDTYV